jgi:putative FmdB family regulatory protein
MPTYEYACTDCGHRFDTVQSFSEPSLTTCPACGGTLRKVFGNVGIVLKGSGFYKTDSRNGSKGTVKSTETSNSSEKSSNGDGSSSKEAKSGESGAKESKESSTSTPTNSAPKSEKATASTGS